MRKEEKIQRLITKEYSLFLTILHDYRVGLIGESEAMFCITETITRILEKVNSKK